jgi:hypothetical protein
MLHVMSHRKMLQAIPMLHAGDVVKGEVNELCSAASLLESGEERRWRTLAIGMFPAPIRRLGVQIVAVSLGKLHAERPAWK